MALLFLSLHLSPSYDECKTEYFSEHSEEIRSYMGSFVAWAVGVSQCGFVAADENEGIVVGFFTAVLAWSTIRLWQETKRLAIGSEQQSRDMRESIAESARAATAMEALSISAAKSFAVGSQRSAQQLRAYLNIIVGSAFYQDRDKGIKFAGRPDIINNGFTPAYRVTYQAAASVLPIPLPNDFGFELDAAPVTHSLTLGPRQAVNLTGFARDYIEDADVDSIMRMSGTRGLYCWGIVHYDDAFDAHHVTRFCQLIRWIPGADGSLRSGSINVIYIDRHNDAD
jgi:hypothetical protein